MRINIRLAELAHIQRGWSLRRLSEELNVDYQNVVNWNSGRTTPHLQIVIQIAKLLRCTLDQLISSELATTSNEFEPEGFPPGSSARRGRRPKEPPL